MSKEGRSVESAGVMDASTAFCASRNSDSWIASRSLESGSREAGENHAVWLHRTIWLIAGLLCFRLIYAWFVPLDLVHDEAYYWDWSRQLDWGYYSKPPMIAWVIAAATSLGGSSAFVVRLPAVLLGTLSLVWMYLLASSYYGRRAGFWTACLSAATPGSAALSLLMTIDAPFLFCWSGALYSFWRLLQTEDRRLRWLIASTLFVGLGVLSKQTMLAFPALALLFVLTSREDRRELFRAPLWIWMCGSVAFLTPVLWWNSQHGWITAQHTGGHFSGESVTLWRQIARCLEFVAGQFGVVSPVTCFLTLAVAVAALLSFRSQGRRERYLLCFSAIPLAGVFALSTVRRVEPNWPAPFYPAALVLLVGLAMQRFRVPRLTGITTSTLARAMTVGCISAVIAYSAPFGCGLQGTRWDPAVRLRGWREVGAAVAGQFSSLPSPDRSFVLVTSGRAVASELAFYMPQQPRVYLWTAGSQVLSQYDIWEGPSDKQNWDALIVTEAGKEAPSEVKNSFAFLENRGLVDIPVGGDRHHRYQLWRGVRLSSWPDSRTAIARARAKSDLR